MSLGNVLATAAPIAAGYFAPGAGAFLGNATANAVAMGALTGAGIAALSGRDLLTSAAMGGLGGYGGGEMFGAFNPAGASGIASATGTTNAAVNQAAMSNMTGSALGQGGFNTAAGRGLMGVASPGMAGAAGAGANTGLQNVTAGNTGQGFSPYATPDTLGESVTQFSTDAAYNAANPNLGIDVSDVVRDRITGQVAGPNLGTGTDPSNFFGDASSYTGAQTPDFANIVKSTPQELAANQARQAVDTSFSAGVERLGGGKYNADGTLNENAMLKGSMKLGLAGLPVLAAAYEPETFTYDQMKEAEAYDPDATLNLDDPELDSGIEDVINEDSGLRLYANQGGMVPTYAEGGTIESRAKKGMTGALARNEGIAYTRPTTAPVTTTAPSNNIKIAGAGNSTTNLTGGVGSLNVNSGSIGQSPNAVAAEAKRIETLKNTPPKYKLVDSGMYGQKRYVPTDYMGIGQFQDDIMGTTQKAGEAEARARAGYAEGGMLEGPGDGMSDSLAAQIDGSQPAALSQGEFVVPADVVSHLGNGSSDAGSKRLYAMMDEVRKARTGTEKQGKEINPERYMPA